MTILIMEDDPHTRAGLAELLAREGFEVEQAADGQKGLALFKRRTPALVCLDVMMPGMSGYDVCREIRRLNTGVPILFISAKGEELDKVVGLELGGDDYLLKPFGAREVIARVRALLRRAAARTPLHGAPGAGDFQLDDLRIFPDELRAYRGKTPIELTPRDVSMLRLFHDRAGKVLDRDTIFDACWGADYFPNSRTLDQHISQLRKRIERDPSSPAIIRTVHGAGYRYQPRI